MGYRTLPVSIVKLNETPFPSAMDGSVDRPG